MPGSAPAARSRSPRGWYFEPAVFSPLNFHKRTRRKQRMPGRPVGRVFHIRRRRKRRKLRACAHGLRYLRLMLNCSDRRLSAPLHCLPYLLCKPTGVRRRIDPLNFHKGTRRKQRMLGRPVGWMFHKATKRTKERSNDQPGSSLSSFPYVAPYRPPTFRPSVASLASCANPPVSDVGGALNFHKGTRGKRSDSSRSIGCYKATKRTKERSSVRPSSSFPSLPYVVADADQPPQFSGIPNPPFGRRAPSPPTVPSFRVISAVGSNR